MRDREALQINVFARWQREATGTLRRAEEQEGGQVVIRVSIIIRSARRKHTPNDSRRPWHSKQVVCGTLGCSALDLNPAHTR